MLVRGAGITAINLTQVGFTVFAATHQLPGTYKFLELHCNAQKGCFVIVKGLHLRYAVQFGVEVEITNNLFVEKRGGGVNA